MLCIVSDWMDSAFYIDDLEGIVEANLQERRETAEKVELFIEAAIVEFKQWLNTLGVVPVISALREKALSIQSDTMQSLASTIPSRSSISYRKTPSRSFSAGSRSLGTAISTINNGRPFRCLPALSIMLKPA
jgi:glutamyl-tRNA reductase